MICDIILPRPSTVSGTPVPPSAPVTPAPSPTPSGNLPFPNLPGNLGNLPGLANLGNLSSIISSLTSSQLGPLACVIPALTGGAIPGGVNLPNSQGALGALTVLQNAAMGQNGGQFNIGQIIGLISAFQPGSISNILTLAGIALNATQCISKVTPVNVPGVTGSLSGQSTTPLNVNQLLGLSNITNLGQLLAMIPKYSQVVGSNVKGANAQALLSTILMGIGQQYQSLHSWNEHTLNTCLTFRG